MEGNAIIASSSQPPHAGGTRAPPSLEGSVEGAAATASCASAPDRVLPSLTWVALPLLWDIVRWGDGKVRPLEKDPLRKASRRGATALLRSGRAGGLTEGQAGPRARGLARRPASATGLSSD